MQQGNIILVEFDSAKGHEQQGYRPAIVISSDTFNNCGLCIVAPISNTTYGPYRIQIPQEYTAKFGTTGSVLLAHMRTVDVLNRKHKVVGSVDKNFVRRIVKSFERQCI